MRPAYVAVAAGKTGHELEFVGEVRAVQRAELAFAVPGHVAAVHVENGEIVHAGQVLATLSPLPLRAQLATASSEFARAENQLAEVRQRHERIMAVQATGAASANELNAIQAELANAHAAQRSAGTQRDAAAWSLEQASLRAPANGRISARLLEPGQSAGPGVPAFSLDGAGRELAVLVPASLDLKAGQAAVLRNGETRLDGKVLRLGGRLEAGGLRRIFLSVPEEADVGSTWRVALPGEQAASTVLIPLRAVLHTSKDSGQVLRLAGDGHTVEQVSVRLGPVRDEAVEIRGDLRNGEQVVVAGAASIRPGSKIQPVPYHRGAQP